MFYVFSYLWDFRTGMWDYTSLNWVISGFQRSFTLIDLHLIFLQNSEVAHTIILTSYWGLTGGSNMRFSGLNLPLCWLIWLNSISIVAAGSIQLLDKELISLSILFLVGWDQVIQPLLCHIKRALCLLFQSISTTM